MKKGNNIILCARCLCVRCLCAALILSVIGSFAGCAAAGEAGTSSAASVSVATPTDGLLVAPTKTPGADVDSTPDANTDDMPDLTPGANAGGADVTDGQTSGTAPTGTPGITPELTAKELADYRAQKANADLLVDESTYPYTYRQMCLDALLLAERYPDRISVEWVGYTADRRPIPAIRFGNPEAEKTILIQAAIHARESMTTLLVMKQLEKYATEYTTGQYEGSTYEEIFREVSLLVVPMTNPDGVSISQLGTQSIRDSELRALVESFYERDGAGGNRDYFYSRYKANANGVDLNRNFPYGWEEYVGSGQPSADHYKGTEPFSEPETQVLRKLTEENKVVSAISYHATGSILYWDFGQEGELRQKCRTLTETVKSLTGYTISYAATDKQDEAGYCEWAVGIKGIPEVTIEIGTVAAPLPASEFAGIWRRNSLVPVAVAHLYCDK